MKTYISLSDVEAKWPEEKPMPDKLTDSAMFNGGYNEARDDCRSALSSAERIRVLTREEIQELIFEAYPQCHDLKRQWDLADRILSAMKDWK